jgi:hypothetical protein
VGLNPSVPARIRSSTETRRDSGSVSIQARNPVIPSAGALTSREIASAPEGSMSPGGPGHRRPLPPPVLDQPRADEERGGQTQASQKWVGGAEMVAEAVVKRERDLPG